MPLTKRNRRSFRTTHARQLRLEPLEDRRLLAVITVDSFLDNFDPGAPTTDGLITLREAILAANTDAVVGDAPAGSGTDTIEFDNALSGQTIILDGMDLEITEAVTIDATPLAANVTIDAGSLSRIFNITATTGDFTLAGLTLTGGMTTGNNVNSSDTTFSGGAVRSLTTGSLTIDQSTVSYNSTTGNYASGSGIRSRGAITITSSTVSGNSTAGDIAKGGGIFSSGPVTLTNSTVSGNSTAGFIATGGGIYSFGALTLTNSTVSGNSTTGSYGYGAGAITFGDVTIVSSTVSDNHAIDSNATGGIWNNNDVINITNSIVAGNTDGGGSVNDIRPGTGPLASFSVNYSLIGTGVVPDAGTSGNNVVTNNPLIGPLADNGGPTETHALLVGSPAIDAGNPGFTSPPDFDQRGTGFPRVSLGRIDMGAYEFQVTFPAQGLVVDTTTDVIDGDFTIGNLALREAILFANLDPLANTITFDASLSGQTITLGGSELLINDELTIDATALDANVTIDANMQSRVLNFTAFPGDLTLSGLTITGGRTIGEFDDGGGIRFSGDTLTLNSSTVSGNSTTGDFAYGGGIWTFSGDVTLTGSTVSGNSTSGSDANGGGIRTFSGAVTLTDSTVSGNSTAGSDADGGGIRTYTGAVTLTDSTVSGNSTTGSFSAADGGGIYTNSGDVTLTGSTVSDNSTSAAVASVTNGGGIHTNSGDVTLTDSTVSGNSSGNDGGGIRTNSGAVTLIGSTVSDNSSGYDGGGIFTSGGDVTLTGSTVSGNSATEFSASGGGIGTLGGDVTLTDSTVSGNSTIGSSASGGGIWAFAGDVTLTGSTVSGNSSDNDGGGIRTSSGDVTLTGSTVSGNSSDDDGGGIWTFSGAVTLTSSTVTGNSAGDEGGGVFVFDTGTNPTLTITNSIVAGNTDNGTAADLRPDPDSTLVIDFSLIGDTTGSGITVGTGTGNILNQSAQLGLLADNGGPTLTHALRVGSPAIDAGDPDVGPSVFQFDQRGAPFIRVVNNPTIPGFRVDIGAYERQTVAGLNLTVDTHVDENDGNYSAGDLSLREAVGLANGSIGANTILFAAALSGQAITLGGTELEISDTLTIDATALAANVTIDANMQSRVIKFSTNPGDLTLSGLTITGGRTIGEFDDGGGIRFGSNGTLTLNSSTVSDNSTSGDLAYGGGIWTFGGAVILNDSTVSDNSTSGLNANGGGIRTYGGAVTLTDSTVRGNSTTGSNAPGGGIFTFEGAVTLTDSTVSGNSTSGDLAYGGGIFTASGAVTLTGSTVSGNRTTGSAAAGGGIRTYSGAVTFTDSTVSDNSTTGANAYGGGIRTSSVSGTVTLTGSTVSGNSSTGTFASGGGIRTFEGAVTLTDSTVSGNFSGNRGGGIFTSFGDVMLTNSTVSGNTSVGDGGGIRTYSSVVTLTSSTVTGNLAYGAGGGVHVYDSTTNPTLTIANSIVAGNTAVGAGPDLRPDPGSTLVVDFSLIGDTTGSGITAGTGSGNILNQPALLGPLADNSGPTLTHALLVGSLAIDAGDPGFTSPPDFDQRGAPFAREAGLRIDIGAYERQTLDPSFFIVTTTTDELDYSNADVSLREAIHSANGSIDADTILFAAALSGQTITLGGTELEITEALTIDATALAANVTIDANMQSRVLRFTALAGDLTLSGLTITGGQTTGLMENGGGIRFDSAGTLTLNSSTLSGNKTTGFGLRGGGIFTYSGAVTLTDSTLSDNSTSGPNANGGGIRTYSGAVTLSNSTVSGNSTAGTFADGGGISTYSGVVTLTNSTVSGNVSAGAGGGIYTDSAVTLMGSTVTGNTAAGAGGGIYVTEIATNPTLTIANSIVAGNTAGGGMDDIDPGTGTLNIDFSLIEQVGLPLVGSGNIIGMPANLGPLASNGGLTQTHALLAGSPAIDAGDPTAMAGVGGVPMFDQRGMPFGRVEDGDGNMMARIDMGAYEVQSPTVPTCDSDGMNGCNIDDIDAMVMEIVAGTNSPLYDLTDDGVVNLADRDQWLADAGALNLLSGNPYLLGDANLDGVVDTSDFNIWNSNKFTSVAAWSAGDFNADGVVDTSDFNLWNTNKFTISDAAFRTLWQGPAFGRHALDRSEAVEPAAEFSPSAPLEPGIWVVLQASRDSDRVFAAWSRPKNDPFAHVDVLSANANDADYQSNDLFSRPWGF